MVKDVCMHASNKNTDNYSSPIPFVGLYIAAASLVCLFLMLCDVWAGFRSKKFWFPCRFFSINSITLTLISIAAKLPVDLTTAMPSAQDQLSKISGTVFICITMSFMLPSIALNGEFEAYANVTALSIFVVTVVVNVCIQSATGVICSFIPEHVIVLVCMLFLLLRFWNAATAINGLRDDYKDKSKMFLRNGGESLLARLRIGYLYGYHSCAQLFAWRAPYLTDVALVCTICSIVFLQAVVRSVALKKLRFRDKVSDYGWSMWFVVATQILSVAVVSVVMGARVLTSIVLQRHGLPTLAYNEDRYLPFQYLFSLRKIPKFLEKVFRFVIYYPLFFFNRFVTFIDRRVLFIIAFPCHRCGNLDIEDKGDENSEEFKNLLTDGGVIVQNWLLRKGVADMQRRIMISKQGCPQHLTKLLSTVHPSEESSYTVGLHQGRRNKISSLSIVLLVEIAKVMRTPASNSEVCLPDVLGEVFEIIHFVENQVNVSSSDDRLDSILGRVIYQYGLKSGIAEFELQHLSLDGAMNFTFAQKFICQLKVSAGTAHHRVDEATQFLNVSINNRPPSEDVYDRVVRVFVDMLHAHLAQLPVAVYTYILESPVEEYEERVRLSLGFFTKLESLQSSIRFSRPSGANITKVYDTQAASGNTQPQVTHAQCESATTSTNAFEVEEEGEIREMHV